MSSDNHANYFKVGLTVLIGVAAVVGTLVYLGGFGDRRDEVLVETYYDKPVTGLSEGSPVNFRGVHVGDVRKISFVGAEYDVTGLENQRIYILMALARRQMRLEEGESAEELLGDLVAKGLRATVTSSGITGMSKVELDYHPGAAAPEALSWVPEHLLIPPKPSLLDSFSDSATRAMNQLNRIDFNAAWSNISAVASSWAAASSDARDVVERSLPSLAATVENLERLTGTLEELAERLKADPSLLIRANDPPPLPETSGAKSKRRK